MNKTPWIWASTLLLAAASASAQQAARQSYIVQLADLPVAGYNGKVAGFAATRPAAGQKLNMRASHVQAYLGYLNSQRNTVISTVGSAPVTHRYNVAFNGFAAKLTAAEVAKLQANAAVLSVTPDSAFTMDTSRTPAFLGLSAAGGLYSQNVTGENVIIGVIDGGITPENPSFSDKVDGSGKPVSSHQAGTVVYDPIATTRPGRWQGACETGPGFPASACNNKLIGARWFRTGFDAAGYVAQPVEFASPRDADGHGSHTASTAGGNANVAATVNSGAVGNISGIAPRARVAAYKVCWLYEGSALATCITTDSVAAIDQAVADGVDVLNYSISGTRTNYLDPVEVAFLFAADAGVFVAASAGNSGPGNTVAHMSPWLTTVAASTHDRLFAANAVLGGTSYAGASLQTSGLASAAGPLPLVLSVNAGIKPLADLNPTQQAALRLCFNATDLADATLLGAAAGSDAALDPAKVAGKIVVCDRGSNARVNKSEAIMAAGGAGMVLINTSSNTLNDDAHHVPSVHLSHTVRTAIRSYAATGTGTGYITAGAQASGVVAPQMASFSSRGPSLANPNILKPDITAPGVSILAAYTPPLATHYAAQIAGGTWPAPEFDFLQGTSMSSPHIAGMGALLKQAHPTWSPAAIKSALMTTTTGVKLASGAADNDRFGYGAGHANPNGASGVPLVYDANLVDYLAFLCGAGTLNPASGVCGSVGFLAPWNLNLASLTAEVVGLQTLYRTVTNVSTATKTFNATATMPGFSAVVTPSTLTLAPGAQGSFAVTATRTTAAIGSWAFGNLDWSDGASTVRSPLTLKPLFLATPALLEDTRVRANRMFTVGTGYDGAMRAITDGLVPATRTAGSVDVGNENCSAKVTVPAGAKWLRVAMFDADSAGQGLDDLDLEVRNAAGTVVASSGGSTTNELVNLRAPAAGTYSLCVIGFGTARAVSKLDYTLSSWLVSTGKGIANSLKVSVPATVATAGSGTVAFLWNVPAGQRYFGTVHFSTGTGEATGQTALYLDNQPTVSVATSTGAKELAKATQKMNR
ncbi:S8 family serine peptidase [Aquabacterium sp. OR-4]|uniref:S8 family serine peptidase n=1 Tax=Aquabacterium sp. OR-4 TaxID=2978127 RepID=UPI0028CB02DC|nr:S8 family serine peptidase [Aquabacterium sp. OR-4]MDT7834935.1 S8 family serine peptidase [Aquabacterium sp. OR-4]